MTQLKTNSAQLKYTIFNPVSLDKSTDINFIWLITDNLISVWFHQATVVIQSVYGRCTLIASCSTLLQSFWAALYIYRCRILHCRLSLILLVLLCLMFLSRFVLKGVIARLRVCKLILKNISRVFNITQPFLLLLTVKVDK